MRVDAIIFDMDGLMLDTEPLYRAISLAAAADCGVTLTEEHCLAFIGRRTNDCSDLLRGWFGAGFDVERYWDRCRHHATRMREGEAIPLKPGLLELLAFLESARVPMAVATSTRGDRARSYLAQAELLGRFTTIVGGDEVARGKPDPEMFLLASQRLGVEPPHCLVLEDAEAGVRAAHAAGMRVCWVPDLQAPSPEAAALAAAVLPSLLEVIPLVEAWMRRVAGPCTSDP